MSHLPIERLAALADEKPNTIESAHLAQCAECTRELDAILSLVSLAGAERDTMSVPLTRWDTLAKQLRSDGLIAQGGGRGHAEGRRFGSLKFSSRAMLQIAAGFLLVAVGMGAGRLSAGASALPGGLSGNEPTRTALADSMPARFESVADASYWQQVYSNRYQAALDYLASHDSSSKPTPSAMRTRLSALDRASATMREALADAPYDPVINDFYLNSFAQREATLRQLNTAYPQGVRLNSF
jgi:hypothetical protein